MDLKEMKELIKFFDKSGITELEMEEGETRLYLSKVTPSAPAQMQPQYLYAPQAGAMPQIPASAPVQECALAEKAEIGNIIESPMIGTYYSAPSPGAAPFINIGDIVEKGQTLCIIEAMKIMNTIEAEYRCKILKAMVQNGNPVEYGQPIFVVEPQ